MRRLIHSLAVAVAALVMMAACVGDGYAQTSNGGAQTEPPPFFNIGRRPDRPDMAGLRAIRFLTDDDYPPFHFPGPDGQLTGFNIDLARAICAELKVACTIQARRWDTLVPSLEEGRADAIIASMVSTEESRARVDFGQPYYRTPARFIARKATIPADGSATPDLNGRKVAVVRGTAHAAFIEAYYPAATRLEMADMEEALRKLDGEEVDAVFGDGIGLSLWLNSPTGERCCRFLGGPFFESRYFGEGAVMAFRKESPQIRRAVDFAVFRLAETGVYQQLLLKYFPIVFY
jgi:polar amino acid transport system substrate-binding protein